MSSELRGVFAPIVTPFRPDDGEVDLPWLRLHLAYLRAHGCTGVIPCGTNGEAASLSVAERQAVVEATMAAADGLVVVPGTGAAALSDAIALTRHAFVVGARAVLVMPPFYFKRPPEEGIIAWYRRLIDAAVPPGGRVLLYHIPQTTGVPISDGIL
ncbi:MAG: dihydrodipicolinate synthase family protein, partial [Anaerolineae bacterium]